jgi:high-affinity Fe2+/Pb2+ permease
MMRTHAVTAVACGLGVFLAGLLIQRTDLGSALIGGVVTGAVALGALWLWSRRRG